MSGKRRLSASVDGELLDVAQAAVEEGRAFSVSAWVNDAMRLKVEHDRRMQAIDAFLARYEADHGTITQVDIDDAVRRASRTCDGGPTGAGKDGQATSRCGVSLLLDAGAFIAVERGDRDVVALVKRERLAQRSAISHGGVVAQIWRGGAGRQAEVARLLAGVDVRPLDRDLGTRAGMLIGRCGAGDAVDAALVCLAVDGDDVLTSDPSDLRALAEAAGVQIDLVPV